MTYDKGAVTPGSGATSAVAVEIEAIAAGGRALIAHFDCCICGGCHVDVVCRRANLATGGHLDYSTFCCKASNRTKIKGTIPMILVSQV